MLAPAAKTDVPTVGSETKGIGSEAPNLMFGATLALSMGGGSKPVRTQSFVILPGLLGKQGTTFPPMPTVPHSSAAVS